MALGYLDTTEESVDPARSGVVVSVDGEVADGYRLYCTRGLAMAELIDVDGARIRSWSDEAAERWSACALMPNGDLIVVGVDRSGDSGDEPEDRHRHVRRLDWSGNEIWRYDLPVHHDVAPLPGGDFLTLMLAYTRLEELHPASPIRDDLVARVSGLGEIMETRSILDVFRSNSDALVLRVPRARHNWGRTYVDLIHANTIAPIRLPELEARHPIYSPGNVIWTSRHQNVVAIVEWDSNRLLWSWGQGELVGPHEGSVLANGNVLILDNGVRERGSRVIEVDPIRNEIVWQYRGESPNDFFTAGRGGAQRLANGNTLITESSNGRAFEVTRDGRIVWEFLTPHLNEKQQRLTFRRLHHYASGEIEPLRSSAAERSNAGE